MPVERRLPLDQLFAISPRRAAMLLDGIRDTHIRNAIRDGKLIARRVGKRSLISVESLRAWFETLPPSVKSKPATEDKSNG